MFIDDCRIFYFPVEWFNIVLFFLFLLSFGLLFWQDYKDNLIEDYQTSEAVV